MPWQIEVNHINVGAGDSTLLYIGEYDVKDDENKYRYGSHTNKRLVLIDGGIKCAFQQRVSHYLSHATSRYLKGLDAIVVTHYDQDHMEGIKGLLEDDWEGYWAKAKISGVSPIFPVRLYDIGPRQTTTIKDEEQQYPIVNKTYRDYVEAVKSLSEGGKLIHTRPSDITIASSFDYPDIKKDQYLIYAQWFYTDIEMDKVFTSLKNYFLPLISPWPVMKVEDGKFTNAIWLIVLPTTQTKVSSYYFSYWDRKEEKAFAYKYTYHLEEIKSQERWRWKFHSSQQKLPKDEEKSNFTKLAALYGLARKDQPASYLTLDEALSTFNKLAQDEDYLTWKVNDQLNINVESNSPPLNSDLTSLIGHEIFWNSPEKPAPSSPRPSLQIIAANAGVEDKDENKQGPTGNNNPTTVINKRSIVMLLRDEKGDPVHYIGGDIDGDHEETISRLLKSQSPFSTNPDYRIPFLKLSHHGSRKSTPSELIEKLNPLNAIISAGGQHQHPSTQIIGRFNAFNLRLSLLEPIRLVAMCYPYYLPPSSPPFFATSTTIWDEPEIKADKAKEYWRKWNMDPLYSNSSPFTAKTTDSPVGAIVATYDTDEKKPSILFSLYSPLNEPTAGFSGPAEIGSMMMVDIVEPFFFTDSILTLNSAIDSHLNDWLHALPDQHLQLTTVSPNQEIKPEGTESFSLTTSSTFGHWLLRTFNITTVKFNHLTYSGQEITNTNFTVEATLSLEEVSFPLTGNFILNPSSYGLQCQLSPGPPLSPLALSAILVHVTHFFSNPKTAGLKAIGIKPTDVKNSCKFLFQINQAANQTSANLISRSLSLSWQLRASVTLDDSLFFPPVFTFQPPGPIFEFCQSITPNIAARSFQLQNSVNYKGTLSSFLKQPFINVSGQVGAMGECTVQFRFPIADDMPAQLQNLGSLLGDVKSTTSQDNPYVTLWSNLTALNNGKHELRTINVDVRFNYREVRLYSVSVGFGFTFYSLDCQLTASLPHFSLSGFIELKSGLTTSDLLKNVSNNSVTLPSQLNPSLAYAYLQIDPSQRYFEISAEFKERFNWQIFPDASHSFDIDLFCKISAIKPQDQNLEINCLFSGEFALSPPSTPSFLLEEKHLSASPSPNDDADNPLAISFTCAYNKRNTGSQWRVTLQLWQIDFSLLAGQLFDFTLEESSFPHVILQEATFNLDFPTTKQTEASMYGTLLIGDWLRVSVTNGVVSKGCFDFSFAVSTGVSDLIPTVYGQLYKKDTNNDPHITFYNLSLMAGPAELHLPLIGSIPFPIQQAGLCYLPIACSTATLPSEASWPLSDYPSAHQEEKFVSTGTYFAVQVQLDVLKTFFLPTTHSAEDSSPVARSRMRTTDSPFPSARTFVHLTAANEPAAGDTTWLNIQKNIGPITVDRIGIGYQPPHLQLRLDSEILLGPLTIDLAGLGVDIDLSQPTKLTPHLSGFGLSLNMGPVKLAGEFVNNSTDTKLDYTGALSCQFANFNINAIGEYSENEAAGDKSLFIFANVRGELGGPAFFFVTGLAGGFGYNSQLIMPIQSEVDQFPLVAMCLGPVGNSSPDLGTVIQQLHFDPANPGSGGIVTTVGEKWLAAGINYTSFGIINSYAMLDVQWGHSFEVNLLGVSSIALPPEGSAFINVVIDFEAILKPEDGFFGLMASLSPKSYIIVPDCHLQGGFAFYLWFGPHPHDIYHPDAAQQPSAGDFVVTLGGYHPQFTKPIWYPDEPRLGFNWVVNDNINIDGNAYFALTPSCAMGGGNLGVHFQDGCISAWCTAYADFLIQWAPLYYTGDIGVDMGVSADIHIWFIHIHIELDLGADIWLEGPPLHGVAHVHLYCLSFTIEFGSQNAAEPTLTWDQFANRFLPKNKDTQQIQPLRLTCIEGQAHPVNQKEAKKNKDSSDILLVDPEHFCFNVEAAIPITQLQNSQGLFFDSSSMIPNLHVRPAKITNLSSSTVISGLPPSTSDSTWTITPITGNVPEAQWGAPVENEHLTPDAKLINTCVGFKISYTGSSQFKKKIPDNKGSGYEYYENNDDPSLPGFSEEKIQSSASVSSGSFCPDPLSNGVRDLSEVIACTKRTEQTRKSTLTALTQFGLFAFSDSVISIPDVFEDRSSALQSISQSPLVQRSSHL